MAKEKKWEYGRPSTASRVFDIVNIIGMLIFAIIMFYPLWFVLCASISDPMQLMRHNGLITMPLGFTLSGYEKVLSYSPIWNAYKITLIVVVIGTSLSVFFSILFAYVLSRTNLFWHKLITWLAVFTMYFSGGMIPTYLVVRGIGMYNTIWAMIFPGLISTFNCIILRTAFYNIPDSLEESALIDGASNLRILFSIFMPLIIPTIATITLFYAVSRWNSWTEALLYVRDDDLKPLQIVLRSILIQGENIEVTGGMDLQTELDNTLLKYVVIIISTLPILAAYPFVQKYFTTGVMIGAVKG